MQPGHRCQKQLWAISVSSAALGLVLRQCPCPAPPPSSPRPASRPPASPPFALPACLPQKQQDAARHTAAFAIAALP